MFPLEERPEERPETPLAPEENGPVAPGAPHHSETLEDEFQDEVEDRSELDDWKTEIRREFEVWLDELDEIPDLEPEDGAHETPDLYSFYAQWAAANSETKKGNRRTAEAFSQWGDTLGRFEGDLKLLREQLQRLATEAPVGRMSREHCLILVELLDRLHRVARAFGSPPQASWFGGTRSWLQAWESQRQAFDILLGHFTSLLEKQDVTRIDTAGLPFDSAAMTAVAAEPDSSRPDQTILEELAPGYRLRGQLLRPAQVKVSLNKSSNSKT
jgi:molecular chaperone GrpE (heat shock protein)